MVQLKQLFIYLTYDCNMKCKHCWVHGGRKDRPLSTGIWKQAIKEARNLGLEIIKFTGGEPFLVKSLLFDLMDPNIPSMIETNGTLLTEHDIIRLSESNIAEIDVSIDFPDAERFESFRGLPHSFKKVTHTIELLHQYSIPVVAVMSVFKENFKEISAVADLVFGLGADYFKIHPVMRIGKAKNFAQHLLPLESYTEFTRILKKVGQVYPGKIGTSLPQALTAHFAFQHYVTTTSCDYKTLLTLLPNGDVSLCGIGITHPSAVLGDIKKESLNDIWNSDSGLLSDLRLMDQLHIDGICKRCIFKKYCANVCPAYVYEVYKTFTSSYPLCEELQAAGLFPEKYLV